MTARTLTLLAVACSAMGSPTWGRQDLQELTSSNGFVVANYVFEPVCGKADVLTPDASDEASIQSSCAPVVGGEGSVDATVAVVLDPSFVQVRGSTDMAVVPGGYITGVGGEAACSVGFTVPAGGAARLTAIAQVSGCVASASQSSVVRLSAPGELTCAGSFLCVTADCASTYDAAEQIVGPGSYVLSASTLGTLGPLSSAAKGSFRAWVTIPDDDQAFPGGGPVGLSLLGGATVPGGVEVTGTAAGAGSLAVDLDLILLQDLASKLPPAELQALGFEAASEALFRWSFAPSGSAIDGASLVFHYDSPTLLPGLAPERVAVYRFDGAAWVLPPQTNDPTQHTIAVAAKPDTAFALGVAPALLSAETSAVSLSQGGVVPLLVDGGPASPGSIYWILGSLSGTAPGVDLGGGKVLGLVWDPYLNWTLLSPSTPPLGGSLGLLDAAGTATAAFTVPPGGFASVEPGTWIWHAAVLLDPVTFAVLDASDPVPNLFLP